jgi:hypothetical protein
MWDLTLSPGGLKDAQPVSAAGLLACLPVGEAQPLLKSPRDPCCGETEAESELVFTSLYSHWGRFKVRPGAS